MTVRPPKVHLGADELREVIMSSIPRAFNQQAEFTKAPDSPIDHTGLKLRKVTDRLATEASSGLDRLCCSSSRLPGCQATDTNQVEARILCVGVKTQQASVFWRPEVGFCCSCPRVFALVFYK